jgi:ribosomal protein L16 Arg81 hydroxylase
LNKI